MLTTAFLIVAIILFVLPASMVAVSLLGTGVV